VNDGVESMYEVISQINMVLV